MARKSAQSQTTLEASIAWIAVLIGAVSLFWYFRKRPPPRRENATGASGTAVVAPSSGSRSLRETIADGRNSNWKIAVTWDVLRSLPDDERRSALTRLNKCTNMHILASVSDNAAVLAALKGIAALDRHRIMFCSTEKGYEAFCRQLTPTVLVSSKPDLCQLLLRFVPWVVHVGDPIDAGRNLLDIRSFNELPLLS